MILMIGTVIKRGKENVLRKMNLGETTFLPAFLGRIEFVADATFVIYTLAKFEK